MVLNFVGNLLGGIFGLTSSRSSNSYNGPSQKDILAQMAQQYAYDKAHAYDQYTYNWYLNNQLFGYNSALTAQNYDYMRESRQTSFQDTRKDLESAGYNPLLALGVQSNSLNPGQTMSGSSFSMPMGDQVFSAISSLGNIAQIKSNIDSSKYVNDLNLATTEKVRSEATGQDINNAIQARTGLSNAIETIKNLRSQGLLNAQQARYYQKQIAVSDSNIQLNSAKAQEIRSQTALNRQHYLINKPNADFSRDHPVAAGTLNRIGNPASAIGGLAGLRYLFKN